MASPAQRRTVREVAPHVGSAHLKRWPKRESNFGWLREQPSSAPELVELLRPAVRDERVLEAIASVPREAFVAPELRNSAWHNAPLPIGEGQTISQPLVVARMCEVLGLTGQELVLDVGTGSGYHAALLARLSDAVVSVERHASLSAQAQANLHAAGVENVTLIVDDGSHGYPPRAPYDAINVAAAALRGLPSALLGQLAPGGRLVAPVGRRQQRLTLTTAIATGFETHDLGAVRFVPLHRSASERE